ncbi:helix-turn-helix transcriptional regulator [Nocardiopsis sediminis]
MSTIFGHGRLRLYLLKLLDESPRHGYEIISLLRDRFLGVYSPSPGTIYPRLARLEEEGLVTHEEVNGRKVYRLTDKGREELRSRGKDLDDLEREITDSVRDVARAVKEDVRDTISSLREELKFTAGGGRRSARGETGKAATPPRGEGTGASGAAAGSAEGADADAAGTAGTGEPGPSVGDSGEGTRGDGKDRSGSWWERDWERFAHGFGALGGVWARRGSDERPEFEQALRDFSERVRDVVREAGHVGESAANDLRRILDDTVDVIRRDMSTWGPRGSDERRDGSDTAGEEAGAEGPAEGASGAAEGGSGPAGDRPSTGTTGDPWAAATDEAKAPGTGPTETGPPANGDPWATATREDGPAADGGEDTGKPQSGPATDTGDEQKPESKPEPEAKAEPGPETGTTPESRPKPGTESETGPEPDADEGTAATPSGNGGDPWATATHEDGPDSGPSEPGADPDQGNGDTRR